MPLLKRHLVASSALVVHSITSETVPYAQLLQLLRLVSRRVRAEASRGHHSKPICLERQGAARDMDQTLQQSSPTADQRAPHNRQ